MGETRSDAELVVAATSGEEGAFAALFDRWFDRVFDVAVRILRDDGLAAETAQDVFLTAWRGLPRLEQPGSFGGWVSRISRNKALNRLERERRSTAVGDDHLDAIGPRHEADPGARLDAAQAEELVWAASAALGERDASILHLHLRHHLAPGELAEELGVTPNNAHQVLFRLRKRLGSAISAWVLWNHGEPRCHDLGAALDDAGITTFGAPAVRLIDRHAEACDACAERRRARLAPDALFSAIPIAVAAPSLRAEVAGALELEGVPVSSTRVPSDADDPGGVDRDDSHGGGEGAAGEPAEPAEPPATVLAVDGGGGAGAAVPIEARRRRRALATAAAAVLLVLMTAAGLALGGGGDDEVEIAGDTTPVTDESPSSPSSSSSTAPGVASPTTPPQDEPAGDPVLGDPAPTTAAPSPPLPPSTSAPTASPPPSIAPPPPTASSSTTSTTTTTTAPPPAPSIVRFVATDLGPGRTTCATPSEHRIELRWSSTGADTATLGPVRGTATAVPPSGSVVRCAPAGTSFELTVVGPGGTDRQTATP